MSIVKIIKKYDPLYIASLIFLFFFLLVSIFIFYWTPDHEQQFSLLAQSFVHGKLYFLDNSQIIEDAVLWDNRFYWPLGPFPSVLLMPFVYIFSFFNSFFYQGYIQLILNFAIFIMAKKLAMKLGWKDRDAYFLAFGFMFASVYQLLVFMSWSWYFVQVVCTFLLFLAIHEYLQKRRFLLIGIYLSLIFMSRFTAGVGILFFTFLIIFDKEKHKLINLFLLGLPVIISGIILLYYNYLRFDDIWQNGYKLANNFLFTDAQRYELLNHGLFKLSNIPTNIYYYFIKTLDPVLINTTSLWGNTFYLNKPYITIKYPGTSFFVVSPLFLYIFKTDLSKKLNFAAFITVLFALPLFLSYYWPGWRQVGPRYLIDILPFVYLLLINSFKDFKLGVFPKILMIVSSLFNFYLFMAVFNA
jgi:hypothetical protein